MLTVLEIVGPPFWNYCKHPLELSQRKEAFASGFVFWMVLIPLPTNPRNKLTSLGLESHTSGLNLYGLNCLEILFWEIFAFSPLVSFFFVIDFLSLLCGSDSPNYTLRLGLYYNVLQLTRTAWEQLSARFKTVIQYGQTLLLSKTLGLICCL